MDLTGKKVAALEQQLREERKRHAEQLCEANARMQFLLGSASDEQILAWAKETLTHISDADAGGEGDPDWRHVVVELILKAQDRATRAEKAALAAIADQEWDLKIYKDGPEVLVLGQLDPEQVPAILYRLAGAYGEDVGSTVEQSLRFEVERYLIERDEALAELAALKGTG